MSIRFFIMILFATSWWFHSCQPDCSEDEVKRLMGSHYKTNLKFPDKLELVNKQALDSSAFNRIILGNSRYYVIHYFAADCEECVNNLQTAKSFIEKNDSGCNVKYLFIAGGPSNYYVKGAMTKIGFNYPVYFEQEYFSFKKANSFPLDDVLYNTVLINEHGQVLLFGGIFNNPKAQDLFKNIVRCAPCNQ